MTVMKRFCSILFLTMLAGIGLLSCSHFVDQPTHMANAQQQSLVIDKRVYTDKLKGFWLGQCIATGTGLVTEMDKIGGVGQYGEFYTRVDWGKPDQPVSGGKVYRAICQQPLIG